MVQVVGRVAADDHQRHPRLLQDRGRQAGAGAGRRSTCATAWPTPCARWRCGRSRRGWSWPATSPPTCPTLLVGDLGRLRQVSSTWSATPSSSPSTGEVVVTSSRRAATATCTTARRRRRLCPALCTLHFEVSDTGIGIPAGEARRPSSSRSSRPTARRRASTAAPAWAWPSRRSWSS